MNFILYRGGKKKSRPTVVFEPIKVISTCFACLVNLTKFYLPAHQMYHGILPD